MDDWEGYDYVPRYHLKSKRIFHRPIIEVDVSAQKGPETLTALVDSGTEVTIMSSEIALLIGINPAGKSPASVYSFGTAEGFIAQVNIVVPEFPNEVLTTNVIFADGVSSVAPYDIVLGQEDFFRRFIVRFEKYKNKFYLKPAP